MILNASLPTFEYGVRHSTRPFIGGTWQKSTWPRQQELTGDFEQFLEHRTIYVDQHPVG
jgi:hypothetical protein